MVDRILYFSYGHNTNIPELKHRVPDAKRIGRAIAPNQQLEINHYTNIVAKDGAKTYGVLWAMSDAGLKKLDYYEGDGKDYDHAIIEILYKDNLYKALTYVAMSGAENKDRPPSHKYIKHVADGYKQNQIPLEQLKIAIANRQNNS